jgi:DNA-binding NtrC family response regulator
MKTQKNKKVFIVDDEPFWTAMLTHLLKDLGYTDIVTFTNGTECINNLYLDPAFVFLDYQMDDVDGLEVLQKIKEYYNGIGVIFCTAHVDLSVAVNAINFGAFDYLLKQNATKKEVASIMVKMSRSLVHAEKIY